MRISKKTKHLALAVFPMTGAVHMIDEGHILGYLAMASIFAVLLPAEWKRKQEEMTEAK